ncbi:hypothetical protein [Ruegeria arenilitoris]|uniref:hypothetical protein n=1 Tax=Ruegeria arenilitoris TaxID=1173585 RepID=UPI00147D813A|nr:hypothetical protein [Ruegeria arenilitoris]
MRQSLAISTLFALMFFFCFALFHFHFGYYFFGQAGFSVGNDDSFISYRYAQNLIEHGVLTFNVSDTPVVEGFSNPLFVLVSALVYVGSGPDLLYPAMAFLGAASIGLAIVLLSRIAQIHGHRELAVPLMLATAFCPPFWIHGTSGLETSWVLLFQVLIWLQCLIVKDSEGNKGLFWLLVATGALVLLRTDGFVFPVLAALWLLMQGQRRAALLVVAFAAGLFAVQVAVRYWYYGLVLPLPVYVKVSGPLLDRLVVAGRLLASISVKNGLFLPMLGALSAGLVWISGVLKNRNRSSVLDLPFELWMIGGLVGYYLYVGGDIYRERFLVVLFPLGSMLLFKLVSRNFGNFALITSASLLIFWQISAALLTDRRLDYAFEKPKYDRWITLGKFLADKHPDALLATGAAGKLPYFSGLNTIDMLGLNTREIAFSEAHSFVPGHNKFDPDFVFSRSPDIICAHLFGSGSMTWGIEQDRYTDEGYHLVYLVRDRDVPGDEILDMRNATKSEVADLIAAGYTYGCILNGTYLASLAS